MGQWRKGGVDVTIARWYYKILLIYIDGPAVKS